MIPPTHQAKKLPGGQEDYGYEAVLHDQGEAYQQPKLVKWECPKVSPVLPKSHILVRNSSNTIPWAWPNRPPD